MKILPINLEDLIHARTVESVRREFKKTWSKPILEEITRTICGFANDFYNLNGGYIIVGIEELDGSPILPPKGLDDLNIDEIQKQIRGQCKRIDPQYQPLLSPEIYQNKQILVIWVPAGDVRPYQAPEKREKGERAYFIRQGSETVKAKGTMLNQLLQMTAKVPFDDRRNVETTIDVVSPALVRNFLADIKSDLVARGVEISDLALLKHLRVADKTNDHLVPKNIALLFFTNDPEVFFPGTRIEVAQFGDDSGGDLIEEQIFRGPIHEQIRQVLNFLNAFSTAMVRKVPNQAEVQRNVAFPYEAMEEAIVNAVYHRGYDQVPEPVKVYLYPDRMEIISYPGPVPGIELVHFQTGQIPPVPNRNRRIGEFLKELRLAEGRGTGIPKIKRKMNENGSPEPVFEFDLERSYFRVILPAHPQYVVINALRESAHLWAVGERQRALANLVTAAHRVPKSGALTAQIIEYQAALGDVAAADKLFHQVREDLSFRDRHLAFITMGRILLDRGHTKQAAGILQQIHMPTKVDDIVEWAVLLKRSQLFKDAHRVFVENYELIKNNPKATHEFAQTKIRLAKKLRNKDLATQKKLTREAVELLRRTIQLSDDPTRNGWCWYDLARALAWLRSPDSEVIHAYDQAFSLFPNEARFRKSYDSYRIRKTARDRNQNDP